MKSFKQKIYQKLYNALISNIANCQSKFRRYLLLKCRKKAMKFSDPIIEMSIRGVLLRMPFSHQLPLHVQECPWYDTALPRISVHLKDMEGELSVIDVGANIGDTALSILDKVEGEMLCIEPERRYFSLLEENVSHFNNVICERVLCDSSDANKKICIQSCNGTASVVLNGANNEDVQAVTIDSLVVKHKKLFINLVKVDTDGYDFCCLKGAKKILQEQKPTLFLEFTPSALEKIGDDANEFISFLERFGYEKTLFYDNVGILMGAVSLKDKNRLRDLINYSKAKPVYYDILAFHQSKDGLYQQFLEKEQALFVSKSML